MRSIAPVVMALRRLLKLAVVDGGILLDAQRELRMIVPWVSRGYTGPSHPARWGVLLGLVVLPEDTCEWLARKEVARLKVGSVEEGEVRVRELAAAMRLRVPWAGHVWERQHEPLGDGEKERLEAEVEEDRGQLVSTLLKGGLQEVLQRLPLEQAPGPPA